MPIDIYTAQSWTTYTPTIIQNAVVASANTSANSSQFKLIGKTMHVTLDVTASAVGTATVKILIGLPPGTSSPGGYIPAQQGAAAQIIGYGYGALGGTVYKWICIFDQVNGITPLVSLSRTDVLTGSIGAVAPTAAIAVNDRFLCNLTYQVT